MVKKPSTKKADPSKDPNLKADGTLNFAAACRNLITADPTLGPAEAIKLLKAKYPQEDWTEKKENSVSSTFSQQKAKLDGGSEDRPRRAKRNQRLPQATTRSKLELVNEARQLIEITSSKDMAVEVVDLITKVGLADIKEGLEIWQGLQDQFGDDTEAVAILEKLELAGVLPK